MKIGTRMLITILDNLPQYQAVVISAEMAKSERPEHTGVATNSNEVYVRLDRPYDGYRNWIFSLDDPKYFKLMPDMTPFEQQVQAYCDRELGR